MITLLWKLKAEALAAAGQVEEAVSLLQAAVQNAQAAGERFLLWRLHASLGLLHGSVNRQAEAEAEFSTARNLIRELADTVPGQGLRGNFLRRASGMLTPSP